MDASQFVQRRRSPPGLQDRLRRGDRLARRMDDDDQFRSLGDALAKSGIRRLHPRQLERGKP